MGRHTGSLRRDNGGNFKPIRQEDFIRPAAEKVKPKRNDKKPPARIGSPAHRLGRNT